MCIPSWINPPSRTCCILFSRPTGLGKHQAYLHVIVFLYLTKTHISIFLSASLESGFARINRTELNNLVPTVVQCNLLILSLYCWLLTLVEPVRYLGKEATVTSTLWPFDLCDHCYLPAQARTEWELRWASILCCTIQQICYTFCQEENIILNYLVFLPTLLEMFCQGGKRVTLHCGLDLFIQQITNDDSVRSHGYDTS